MLASGAVQPQDTTSSNHVPDNDEADEQGAYDFERTAPAQFVSGQALTSAQQQAQGLGDIGPGWQQFTTQAYNAEPSGYDDPLESNAGAGFGLVGGRTTALIQAPDGPGSPGPRMEACGARATRARHGRLCLTRCRRWQSARWRSIRSTGRSGPAPAGPTSPQT